ncbi:UNVERIFIED_CONTAM: Chaperone protein dnaJ 20, chloroplastic [Sesamum angustifolium]|uniref:Chaperone protein dnaJ 20, chloroplastic n=1 Tax=Sesamum angustifolium TaxID=2727405 RepID=A0AAW2QNF2_9LAMI
MQLGVRLGLNQRQRYFQHFLQLPGDEIKNFRQKPVQARESPDSGLLRAGGNPGDIVPSAGNYGDGKQLFRDKEGVQGDGEKVPPGRFPPERVDEYTRRFILVHEAYETLSNPEKRASYDRDLASGSGFGCSAGRKSRQYHQGMEEKREWKYRWEVQVDELKRRRENFNSNSRDRGRVSWGARMRNQTS